MTCRGPVRSVLTYLRVNVRVLGLLYRTHYVRGKHFKVATQHLKKAYLARLPIFPLLLTRTNRTKNQKRGLQKPNKGSNILIQIFRLSGFINTSINFLHLLIFDITEHYILNHPFVSFLPSAITIPSEMVVIFMLFSLILIKYPFFSKNPLLFFFSL